MEMTVRVVDAVPKLCAPRRNGWTQARREQFLNHLAATCNVTASCRAVGMGHESVYRLRRRDAVFAEQWRAALLTGYDRLELLLVERAIAALDGVEHSEQDAATLPALSVEDAIRVLNMHHMQMRIDRRGNRRGGAKITRATEEETNAAILKQLAALERRRQAEAAGAPPRGRG